MLKSNKNLEPVSQWVPNLRNRGKGHKVSLSKPFPTVPETTGRKAAQVRLKGTINRKFDGMVILMKKIRAVMLSLLACTVLLAGCNTSSESNEEQPLKVYSFSGENEYISVSNGVIILDGKDEICYGGDLKVMSDDFSDITTYSTTIYINGSEKEILLSNGVDDQTGGTIDVSGNIGKISGDILGDSDDKLTDNLWFELKTTNLSGEENTYQVQLKTTEITKEVKK